MTAVSKVSRRLTQAIAPEVVEHIYKPRLGAELQIVFPYLSALNQAHLVMLARQGILKPETARGSPKPYCASKRKGRPRSHRTPCLRTRTSTSRPDLSR